MKVGDIENTEKYGKMKLIFADEAHCDISEPPDYTDQLEKWGVYKSSGTTYWVRDGSAEFHFLFIDPYEKDYSKKHKLVCTWEKIPKEEKE